MSKTLILDELRRLILIKIGIRVISPSDCRIISSAIQKELKKNISETTIKRLYGFASIKHDFSKFTINTLSDFVGLANESNSSPNLSLAGEPVNHLSEVQQKALRQTHITLQNIRNRCCVPYEMTIPRDFSEYEFDFFRSSNYSFTSFISQPGYGKTILLSHLVQYAFLNEKSSYKKDLVLFLNADYIFNKELEDLSFEDRIKIKLGLHPNVVLVDYFNTYWIKQGIKLIIIIDGFSELAFNKSRKNSIFINIINFIEAISQAESVKLMLGMRSTTWSMFYERIRHSHFLKSKWFSGSYFNLNNVSNVPALSETEVERICHKMSPLEEKKISNNLKAQLKFPFHIQWYYQLREEYPDFESYTNIIYYEIIARFIQEKIYNSTYATEKVLFCKKIIQLTNYGRKGYMVSKAELIHEMPVFKNAYSELLSNGILMEEKLQKEDLPAEYVRFIQPHIFEYFLFLELYELFNHTMDRKFFELINKEYTGNQVRFQLLQWSVRLLVRLNQLKTIEDILCLKLSTYEKNYLIYFIAENLNYKLKNDPNVLQEIKEQRLHQLLIFHLIHFDFVDSCYKDAIKSLIHVTDDPKTQLLYHSLLSIFDCLSLNQPDMLQRMEALASFSHERSKWEIDPMEILRLVHLKTKGIAVADDSTLEKIDHFINHSHLEEPQTSSPSTKQIITYLLILTHNLFYGSPACAIKIVLAIRKRHPEFSKTLKPVSIYFLSLLAQANAKVNPGAKADQMERILIHITTAKPELNLTLHTQSLILAVKAMQSTNRKEYQLALKYAEECLAIYLRNDLIAHAIGILNLIIHIYTQLFNKFKLNEYHNQKMNLLKERNIDPSVFIN